MPSSFRKPQLGRLPPAARLSTAGDPMFYGADNFETARLEVCGKKNDRSKVFSAVQFESCRALHIVDLTDPEFDASFFQPKGGQTRKNVAFLRYFAVAISKEARKDEVQHLDYLPTQTLTSHFRQSLKSDSGIPIDGIRYRSSIDRQPCVVLFFDQVDCLRSRAGRNQAIAYVDATIRHHADS